MSAQWKPAFTSAGLAALQAAHGQGVAVKISHVALGSGVYEVRDPDGLPTVGARAQTALLDEHVRVPVGPLSSSSPYQVAVQAELAGGEPAFWIGEVGFITDTGVLLAVWSSENGLGFRNPDVPWLFKFVLAWSDLPAQSITVVMPEGNGAVTALSQDLGYVLGKVQHTVEVGGGVEWSDTDNTQLTVAISTMVDTRLDVAVAVLDAGIALASTYDIPFMAGWGPDFQGEDLAAQGYGAVALARNITVLGEVGVAGVAPVGADLILDIEVNGASIYTTKPKIAAGATALTAGVLDPAKVNLSAGDLVVFKVVQTGGATKGRKLAVTLKGKVR
ncbi:MAG: phage tail protein [Rhodospirillaceae bacterium]|nr:phage tail protein [Rhodospirillales bacterium]